LATKEQIRDLKQKAVNLRCLIIEMLGYGKAGHLGGSCSCADIIAALYFYKMKYDPKDPKFKGRDRFVLSKGHAAPAQYAALAEVGYFPVEALKSLKELGSFLQGHPDLRKTPGIEANTGSLGQGLSIACGMAMGLKLDGSKSKVYTILGDGEIAEGQVWEATMAASNYKLDNLVAILDKNSLGSTGFIAQRFDIKNPKEKWEAFGWHVLEIDGHDMEQICDALDKADEVKEKPVMIIANTVKGKCISFAENNPACHNYAMTEEQYYKALTDLNNITL